MWKLLKGDWFDQDECFTIPDHKFGFTQEISDKPLKFYYRQDYLHFVRRTLAKHSLEGKKTLLELKYDNYDDESSWICNAENYIMTLYNHITANL